MLYECLKLTSLYNSSNAQITACTAAPHNSLSELTDFVDICMEGGTYHSPGSSSCSLWHYAEGRSSADNVVVRFWSNPSTNYRQPQISHRTWVLTVIRIDST